MSTKAIVLIVAIIVVIGGVWYFIARNPAPAQNSQPAAQTTTQTTQASPMSSDTSITSFNFMGLSPEVDGIVDNMGDTVTLTVPAGTDVTNLVPTIVVANGATIYPDSDVAQDFTYPVTYTVTAQDGTTQTYTVTVSGE